MELFGPEGQADRADQIQKSTGYNLAAPTASSNEDADKRNTTVSTAKKNVAEAVEDVEADGLMYWDEIEDNGEPDNSDTFAQLAAMASGMFSAEPEESDE